MKHSRVTCPTRFVHPNLSVRILPASLFDFLKESGTDRKPRANNAYFRALRSHPKDAVDAGNPLQ